MTDEIREAFEKLHNFDLETDEDGDYTKLETSTCFNFYMAGHQAAKADSEKEIAELQAQVEALHDKIHYIVGEDSEQIKTCCCNWDALQVCEHHSPLLMKANENISELQAQINNLLEGLQKARSMVGHPDNLDVIYEYLHRTPAQSLKAHDDALIDKCVKAILDVGGQRVWEFADAIKFLGK